MDFTQLYSFIDELCRDYNIDESHNLIHSKDCVEFAHKIMDYNCTAEERQVIIYAAALHDCVDKKYVNVEVASKRVHDFLLSQGWSKDMAGVVLRIITSMSYSMLNAQKVGSTCVFPDHGPWQRAYHIVRHADLLCSYRVERCYQYQRHLDPNMPSVECWEKVEKLIQRRVFRYVSDGWITLTRAQALVPELVRKAQIVLDKRAI